MFKFNIEDYRQMTADITVYSVHTITDDGSEQYDHTIAIVSDDNNNPQYYAIVDESIYDDHYQLLDQDCEAISDLHADNRIFNSIHDYLDAIIADNDLFFHSFGA